MKKNANTSESNACHFYLEARSDSLLIISLLITFYLSDTSTYWSLFNVLQCDEYLVVLVVQVSA